jgi:MerR family transcriptional regulator, copper efflux regulator
MTGGVGAARAGAVPRPARAAAERARPMTIGEAARASGASEKMIRHYEAIGLLAPLRIANGYRAYAEGDVAVLRFIRHARDLAFPLEEVRRLLALWRDAGRASEEVRRIALGHVGALEAKARSLSAIAASLRHLAEHCHGDARPDCPILEELAQGPETQQQETRHDGQDDDRADGGGDELRPLRARGHRGDPGAGPGGGGAGGPRRRHRARRDHPAS